MFDSVHLKNFKCFQDDEIRLGGLTVLAGLNGSGKSTVIQALMVLRQSSFAGGVVGARPVNLRWQGPLVDIGTFDQVLSEGAHEESIVLKVSSDSFGQIGARVRLSKNEQTAEGIETSSESEGSFYRKRLFYLSADRLGPQETLPSVEEGGMPGTPLGKTGKHVLWYLGRYGRRHVSRVVRLPSEGKDTLLSQTNAWLGAVSPGAELRATSIPKHNFSVPTFSFSGEDGARTRDFWATNVGFGLSYVLPVVVAFLAAQEGDLVVIENPEAHLHPAGQAKVAELAARAVAGGAQVVLETHSDHVLDGVRLAVRDEILHPDQVVLNYFERVGVGVQIATPVVHRDGRLDRWPAGFFDQQEINLARLVTPGRPGDSQT